MSDEKVPIKLKVDPQELHKGKPARTQIKAAPVMDEECATVALKKNEIPIAIKAVQPIGSEASDNATKTVEAQLDNIRKQNKKQRKHVKTRAEAAYRKSVLISIAVLLLLLIVLSLAVTGAVSFYLIRRVIDRPANGYVLHKAVFEIRNTPGISEKCQIISRTWEEIRDKSDDNSEDPEKKSGGGTLNHIRNRSRAAEDAARDGVR